MLAPIYEGAPIGITVEGANILTRSLIVFGQGAIRCHPVQAHPRAGACGAGGPDDRGPCPHLRARRRAPARRGDLARALPDGQVLWITGAFESIERPHKLAYSWQIGDEPVSRVTVRFAPCDGDRTEVTVLHERIASQAARDDHARGWDGCLAGLTTWAADTPPA